jgi:hypothetical protein
VKHAARVPAKALQTSRKAVAASSSTSTRPQVPNYVPAQAPPQLHDTASSVIAIVGGVIGAATLGALRGGHHGGMFHAEACSL